MSNTQLSTVKTFYDQQGVPREVLLSCVDFQLQLSRLPPDLGGRERAGHLCDRGIRLHARPVGEPPLVDCAGHDAGLGLVPGRGQRRRPDRRRLGNRFLVESEEHRGVGRVRQRNRRYDVVLALGGSPSIFFERRLQHSGFDKSTWPLDSRCPNSISYSDAPERRAVDLGMA